MCYPSRQRCVLKLRFNIQRLQELMARTYSQVHRPLEWSTQMPVMVDMQSTQWNMGVILCMDSGSTWKELQVVRQVLEALVTKLRNQRVHWFTDNQNIVKTGSRKPQL